MLRKRRLLKSDTKKCEKETALKKKQLGEKDFDDGTLKKKVRTRDAEKKPEKGTSPKKRLQKRYSEQIRVRERRLRERK